MLGSRPLIYLTKLSRVGHSRDSEINVRNTLALEPDKLNPFSCYHVRLRQEKLDYVTQVYTTESIQGLVTKPLICLHG